MEGLQRSEISFRRQGSSGLIWDDKFLSEEINKAKAEQEGGSKTESELEPKMTRSRSAGERPYRTHKMDSPTVDPPSPKVSGCSVLCGFFSKPAKASHKPKSKKRKM